MYQNEKYPKFWTRYVVVHFSKNCLCIYENLYCTGRPLNGTFSNVMIDVGKCSGECQGNCLPTNTKRENFLLYSGPREVEIIDSCECLASDSSSCASVKKKVTYFKGTSSQATVNVKQCAGSCGGMHYLNAHI